MAIEIVDLPIKNGGSFHCYVSLPEGMAIDDYYLVIELGEFVGFSGRCDSNWDVFQGSDNEWGINWVNRLVRY